MFNKLNNYINSNDYKIVLLKDMLNILNYEKLLSIQPEYISLKIEKKIIRIRGENLFLKKILNSELLITGQIKTIEVTDEQ